MGAHPRRLLCLCPGAAVWDAAGAPPGPWLGALSGVWDAAGAPPRPWLGALSGCHCRYVQFLSGLLSGAVKMNASPLFLHCVVLHGTPSFDAGGGECVQGSRPGPLRQHPGPSPPLGSPAVG